MGVDLGGDEVGVAEEFLDTAQVGACVKHVGGKAVTKSVKRNALVDLGELHRGMTIAVELTGRERVDRVLAWEEPPVR